MKHVIFCFVNFLLCFWHYFSTSRFFFCSCCCFCWTLYRIFLYGAGRSMFVSQLATFSGFTYTLGCCGLPCPQECKMMCPLRLELDLNCYPQKALFLLHYNGLFHKIYDFYHGNRQSKSFLGELAHKLCHYMGWSSWYIEPESHVWTRLVANYSVLRQTISKGLINFVLLLLIFEIWRIFKTSWAYNSEVTKKSFNNFCSSSKCCHISLKVRF